MGIKLREQKAKLWVKPGVRERGFLLNDLIFSAIMNALRSPANFLTQF